MQSERARKICVTVCTAAVIIAAALLIKGAFFNEPADKEIKIGFVYVGDSSDSYTNNFIKAQNEVEKQFGEKVTIDSKFNVAEDKVGAVLERLVEEECDIIFSTSYGFGEASKACAEKFPEVEFCQVGCSNANEEPKLKNYHTFMGSFYQGRYISGVAAGMKLKELIENGSITAEQAKIGFIGAYPYTEVITSFTSFLLGVRSVVPEAVMTVRYTYSWANYQLEKELARELIDEEGCVIITQHTDTEGPAVACEETDRRKIVFYVSYNADTHNVAPTTYLVGSRINWAPYVTGAVGAVLRGKSIESCVKGRVNGNDVGAGFEKDWVQMLQLNEFTAAKGTKERINELIKQFEEGSIMVFKGDYTGVNPNDPSDVIDLRNGYSENEKSSSPTFCYILDDVITVK